MLTVLSITLLAYLIAGRSVEPLLRRLRRVDWRRKAGDLHCKIREYALRGGRAAARPLLQFYYVMTDDATPLVERAMIYGAIIYTVLPVSAIPQRLFRLLGVLDEGAAVLYVYRRVKSRITPAVEARVEATLEAWFGYEYAAVVPAEE